MLKTSSYWVRYEYRKRCFFLSTEEIAALERIPTKGGDGHEALAITMSSGVQFKMEEPYADAFAEWWWATKLSDGYKVDDLNLT